MDFRFKFDSTHVIPQSLRAVGCLRKANRWALALDLLRSVEISSLQLDGALEKSERCFDFFLFWFILSSFICIGLVV